ncbi:hypothetical protein LJ656_14560 [Paraburkholderia sp. MMS20-SJTR3]|uniref:Secreted protein n=1 Tax=Paraburkholderia sejongensis TaxID=2886946 RepID=A0ABS8JV80_9BURK|nr:hypothetical protein [Paraburkholderia sp. MMS20-SJTR3]MCC8393816.1 hypothetical protein [Paraburkholderia sp. MMS20-SJTR3]
MPVIAMPLYAQVVAANVMLRSYALLVACVATVPEKKQPLALSPVTVPAGRMISERSSVPPAVVPTVPEYMPATVVSDGAAADSVLS